MYSDQTPSKIPFFLEHCEGPCLAQTINHSLSPKTRLRQRHLLLAKRTREVILKAMNDLNGSLCLIKITSELCQSLMQRTSILDAETGRV